MRRRHQGVHYLAHGAFETVRTELRTQKAPRLHQSLLQRARLRSRAWRALDPTRRRDEQARRRREHRRGPGGGGGDGHLAGSSLHA
jgi:hypothetical protein